MSNPTPVSPPRSEELRKEARQLKKELQAIKQRKEEGSKPAVENDQEGKRKQLLFRRVHDTAVLRGAFKVKLQNSSGTMRLFIDTRASKPSDFTN